jgi:hypothetical protein
MVRRRSLSPGPGIPSCLPQIAAATAGRHRRLPGTPAGAARPEMMIVIFLTRPFSLLDVLLIVDRLGGAATA